MIRKLGENWAKSVPRIFETLNLRDLMEFTHNSHMEFVWIDFVCATNESLTNRAPKIIHNGLAAVAAVAAVAAAAAGAGAGSPQALPTAPSCPCEIKNDTI